MKQQEKYFAAGMLLLITDMLAETLFHVSYAVTLPITALGALCMFQALRLQKRAKQQPGASPTLPQSSSQRAKRALIFLSSLGVGSVLSFFLMRHSFPTQSVAFHLCTAGGIFTYGVFLAYRLAFPRQTTTRHEPTPNEPNA